MQPAFFDRVLEVLGRLQDREAEYVLVGGLALNLHGLVRATEDVDLFIKPTPDNVERVKAALRDVWNDPEIEQIDPEDLCGEYPVVRYGPPEEVFLVDLLTRLGEAVRYQDLQFEYKDVEGVRVRVATPATLYWMKRDTVRPQDRLDAAALKQTFDLEE